MPESISVVVTCHNLESYIGLALESVLNQDFRGPVEVVVIDDCSTDRSAEIIKSYPNVRYLRPERNLGVLMATVFGIESTAGELVFFLDGDDLWEPSKLSAVIERFRTDPRLALVTHDLKYIDGSGHLLDRKSRSEEVMAAISSSQEDAVTRDGILLHSDYVWLGSAYAIHRTLGNVEGFCTFAKALPDPFNTYQDWPLAFWVAAQKNVSLGYVAEKLFQYRLHGSNYSGDASSLDRAIRNTQRAANTTAAMRDIATRFDLPGPVKRQAEAKLAYGSYLVDLYCGNRSRALANFIRGLAFMRKDIALMFKECIRFAGIQALGARRFIHATIAVKRALRAVKPKG